MTKLSGWLRHWKLKTIISAKSALWCKYESNKQERLREASHIDFVHEKRHMDVGGGGGGVAPVTFLGEKS